MKTILATLLRYRPRHLRKAIGAAAGAGLLSLAAALKDLDLTRGEIGTIVSVSLVAAVGAFVTNPNDELEPRV